MFRDHLLQPRYKPQPRPFYLDEGNIQRLIQIHAKNAGSLRNYAKQVGLSEAYLSAVANGHQHPGPKLLKVWGLRKIHVYERIYQPGKP